MFSSEVTISVGPDAGDVPARQFLDAVGHSLSILRELDAAISLKRTGTLRWVLGGLSLGSPATVTLRGVPPAEGRDFGPQVVRALIDGLNQLETEGTAPPSFTHGALEAAGQLGRLRLHPGGRVTVQVLDRAVTVTERISASVRELSAQAFTTMGSIEGTLEMVTIHERRYFRVYDAVHGLGVPCYFAQEQLDNVRAGLGKRVSVSGRMQVNREGDKLLLQVENYRIFPSEEKLPRPGEIRGLVPDLTGGRLSEDYLREMWSDTD